MDWDTPPLVRTANAVNCLASLAPGADNFRPFFALQLLDCIPSCAVIISI